MDYTFKYAIFHWIIHLTLASLLAIFLKLNFFGWSLAFLLTIVVDLDHLNTFKIYGIKGLLNFEHMRSYKLHNFFYLGIFFILSLIFLKYGFIFFSVISLSVLLHLAWDLFEDVIIFKMGTKHWKMKKINKQLLDDLFYSTIGRNIQLQNLEKEFRRLSIFLKQKKVRARNMIDFCCGDGEVTRKIAEIVNSKEVWGIDLNEELLNKCKEKNIKTIKQDMKKKIFLRKNFELTVCHGSLHHFDCQEKIIRDMVRHSKKYILIIDKCRYSKSLTHRIISFFNPFELGANILHYEKILEMIKANNIKIIDWKVYSDIHPFSDLIFILGKRR